MFIYTLSIFLTSTAFVDTKAKPRARRGENSDIKKMLKIFSIV